MVDVTSHQIDRWHRVCFALSSVATSGTGLELAGRRPTECRRSALCTSRPPFLRDRDAGRTRAPAGARDAVLRVGTSFRAPAAVREELSHCSTDACGIVQYLPTPHAPKRSVVCIFGNDITDELEIHSISVLVRCMLFPKLQ